MFFGLSFTGQVVSGHRAYTDEQRSHDKPAVPMATYLRSGHFVEATFQNWQSEFLAVAAIVALSIYLREKGSPESKPVHAPHAATGG